MNTRNISLTSEPARPLRIHVAGGLLLFTVVSLIAAVSARAQAATQAITLQPGWNAIWLEVQPTNNATAIVFSNLPIASVWTRAERLSSVDFIQNPSEEAFNEAGWLRWFHPARPEAFLGNLFSVHANRAYLIKSTNSAPINWSVTGRPSLRTPEWVPDSYNLRGVPVDAAVLPTFLNFFRHSRAHYNSANGQLEKIYRLNSASGQWQLVAPTDVVQHGAAYWIYTRGGSDFLAPLAARLETGDGLDFGSDVTELSLRVANGTAGPMNVTLRETGAGAGRLAHYQFNPTLGGQWSTLSSPLVISNSAGTETRVRLAVRRQNFTDTNYASILEVSDGTGSRLLVPVAAQSSAGPLHSAGLWVGAATINAVSEAHSATPTNPTPTKSQLNLRLIIHVDTNGQARLLKEVTQMWRNGTYTNDAGGNRVVEKPGEYVLLTDDTLIPFFNGALVRDGESVGRRTSSIGYDFPTTATNNYLNLSGFFTIGQSLSGTLTLAFDHPTNPFQHKYHPDHDNLNARFDGPTNESYTTTRQIRIDFAPSPPDGPAVPDFGYNQMGGNYRETITGIHKRAIHVSGTFRLSRVSPIAQLNPSPTP
uniref:Uncharacterized protein n=1 Tax=uncultured bacterium Lac161 TaxID=1403002 RepID=A0A059Q9R0_9BACT|nr:hypothetical protein [uncultured bacterium Lac161]